MSGATAIGGDLGAGTSGDMDTTVMETDEYYNPEGGEWSQKVDTGQLCRVCANPNEYLIPIFDGEGLEHELATKIQKHLPIKVTETDTLPQHMCYQCASTLIAWHDLVIGCIEADKKLRELQAEDDDDDDDKGADMFESHSMDSEPADEVDQPSTSEIPSPVKKAPSPKKVTPSKEKKPKLKMVLVKGPPAGTSGQKTAAKTQVAKALELAKSKEGANQETASERCDNFKQHKTANASVHTAYIKQENICIYNNVESVEDAKNMSECEVSGKRSDCKKILSVYTKNEKQISDSSSDDNLSTSESEVDDTLQESAQSPVNKSSEFACNSCGKIFRCRSDLNVHVGKAMCRQSHVCHLCGKQYQKGYNLKQHIMISHDKIKNFVCDICGWKFSEKQILKDHRRTHTGERPWVCEKCGRTFPTRTCLHSHNKRIHLQILPHSCNYCSKRFVRPVELHHHILTHTGEKPHTCDICGKKFRTSSVMRNHRRCHSEERPFVCATCGRGFKLRKHIKTHCKIHIREMSDGKVK